MKPTAKTMIYTTPEFKEHLKEVAVRERRTLSAMIVYLLEQALKTGKGNGGGTYTIESQTLAVNE